MMDVLLISVIGMGLVFGAILLLWLFMELVVRFTGDKPVSGTQVEPVTTEDDDSNVHDRKKIAVAAAAAAIQLRKQQAAAIAVAVALAKGEESVEKQAADKTGSSWQPVMRSLQRRERSRLFNRKSRGSA